MHLDFQSDGMRCAATLYRPADLRTLSPCVVMAHGFTGTRDQLIPYAENFASAGLTVLTFDYRHFGDSEGEPRQIVNIKKQLDDWRAAVRFVRALGGVDAQRIALWGTSLSGGHVINLAAEDPTIAAVVVQVPAIDKSAHGMAREATAKMKREEISMGSLIGISLKSLAIGIYDAIRAQLRLPPHYMRVFGSPGSVAAFTDPDSDEVLRSFTEAGPTWRNEFAPRFLFGTPKYVPGTAERVRVPLLVCVAQHDTEADPELAMEIARKAPRGELEIYPVRHFAVYRGPVFGQIVADQTEFLCRALKMPNAAGTDE
jgi:pimeloyl-ACP methyl ester carboxylesterase